MTTPTRAALIAAGYTVYRPKPGTALIMRHGHQVAEAGDSAAAWAWVEREMARERDEAGRKLARQMRMRLEIAGPTGAERNHT